MPEDKLLDQHLAAKPELSDMFGILRGEEEFQRGWRNSSFSLARGCVCQEGDKRTSKLKTRLLGGNFPSLLVLRAFS